MKIILASKSLRRQELLTKIGLNYEVVVSSSEEVVDPKLSPLDNCINISFEKAKEVKEKTKGDRIIISCDTIVVKDNKIYGKPKDKEEAFNMLKLLSNTYHDVYSCLTVIKVKDNKEEIFKEQGIGTVYIDSMTDMEINDWIEKGNPYDKAGGYAIQEEFGKYITETKGDFYSIVGIPLNKLYNLLKKIDF
ncbi:MAG: septum formation protein Maf [Bacilli bacterium]|nr:septum formation protein Maf [Bacilli bacterium]